MPKPNALSRDPHCGDDTPCRRWQDCADRTAAHLLAEAIGEPCVTCEYAPSLDRAVNGPGRAVPLTVYVTEDGRHQAVVRTCQATRSPACCVLVTMGRVGGLPPEEVHVESSPSATTTLVFTADVEVEPAHYTSREAALADVLSRFLA